MLNQQSFGRKHTITTTNADPCYAGVVTRKDIVTITNTESVAMQSNPAYTTTIRESIVTTANTELVAMQPNPAYAGYDVNTTQLKSESLV